MMVIFNPVAGRRRGGLLWKVLDVLAASGIRFDLAETRRAGHARELTRDAVSRGEILVVAAGGDGTVAEVASGLMGSDACLGIIPLGTANVLAHELALPFVPHAVAAALAFGRTKRLWPGIATSAAGTRLFVQMLGVGFDAQVVANLPFPLKKRLGKSAYVLQALRELPRYRFPAIELRVDEIETRAASVIITKGRFYGGRFRLTTGAAPGEPGFSVVLFDRSGPAATLMYGAALPVNLLGRAPGVRHLRGHRIVFPGTQPVATQADGDAAGIAPLVVEDAPGPIQIVTG